MKNINSIKQWKQEKCGTNTPPITIPEKPSTVSVKQSESSLSCTCPRLQCKVGKYEQMLQEIRHFISNTELMLAIIDKALEGKDGN